MAGLVSVPTANIDTIDVVESRVESLIHPHNEEWIFEPLWKIKRTGASNYQLYAVLMIKRFNDKYVGSMCR